MCISIYTNELAHVTTNLNIKYFRKINNSYEKIFIVTKLVHVSKKHATCLAFLYDQWEKIFAVGY